MYFQSGHAGCGAISIGSQHIAIVAGWNGRIRLIDTSTMSMIRSVQFHRKKLNAVLFGDGSMVAAAGDDKLISLWNFENLLQIK